MLFEKASELKLRFITSKGCLTTEDLWDLPLTSKHGPSLDGIAKSLRKDIKESTEESFVKKKTDIDAILETKFSIVKRVIEVRLENAEKKKMAIKTKEKRQQILELIADKEKDQRSNLSIEELKAMLG